MTRPPRDPGQPLLTRALIGRILLVSFLMVAAAWYLFEWEVGNGATLPEARTAALNLFVVVEAFYLFNCRSLTQSIWRIGFFTNRWLILGVVAQILAQIAITYLPAMNSIFQTAPLGLGAWLRIVGIAAGISAVVGAEKWVRAHTVRGFATKSGKTLSPS